MTKELTKNEKYAKRYFVNHGFEILDIKLFNSKAKFTIKKDEYQEDFELPRGVEKIGSYMKSWYNGCYLQWCKIQELKKQASEMRVIDGATWHI